MLEADAAAFSLDRKITPEKKDEVILRSIERLLERDNPSLEMFAPVIILIKLPFTLLILLQLLQD